MAIQNQFQIMLIEPSKVSRGHHNLTRKEWLDKAHLFCARGSQLPQTKLTEEQVKEIRENRKGKIARELADQFHVHIRTIEKIRAFQTWKHI